MGLETLTGTVYIDALNSANPVGASDAISEGDDHIRGIKNVLLLSFPAVTGAVTSTHTELNLLDGCTSTTAELNIVDGVTATATEINYLDITSAGTAEASKAVVLDASKGISTITSLTSTTINAATTLKIGGTSITSTATEINLLDGVTATTTEINYNDVTTLGTAEASKAVTTDSSNDVIGLNALTSTTVTGTTVNASTSLEIGGTAITATAAEINNLDGTDTVVRQNYGIYHGRMTTADASTEVVPSGWTITTAATGKYTVTHNLGLSTYTAVACGFTTTSSNQAHIRSQGTNSFEVWTVNASGTNGDANFSFTLMVD